MVHDTVIEKVVSSKMYVGRIRFAPRTTPSEEERHLRARDPRDVDVNL